MRTLKHESVVISALDTRVGGVYTKYDGNGPPQGMTGMVHHKEQILTLYTPHLAKKYHFHIPKIKTMHLFSSLIHIVTIKRKTKAFRKNCD